MLSAITASTGAGGTCTKPSVAAPSVMLCATVNAVTVATSRRTPRTSNSNASTNSKWSTPSRMCSMPSPVYVRTTSNALGRSGIVTVGSSRVSRWFDAAAVEIVDAQQHVGLRLAEPVDGEFLAAEPAGAEDRAVLRAHVVDDVRAHVLGQRAASRHLRLEHRGEAAGDRHLPLHVEGVRAPSP